MFFIYTQESLLNTWNNQIIEYKKKQKSMKTNLA